VLVAEAVDVDVAEAEEVDAEEEDEAVELAAAAASCVASKEKDVALGLAEESEENSCCKSSLLRLAIMLVWVATHILVWPEGGIEYQRIYLPLICSRRNSLRFSLTRPLRALLFSA